VIRWGVLGAVLVAVTIASPAHQAVTGSGRLIGVDAFCPFGGIETLFAMISGVGFVEKTAAAGIVLLIGTLAVTLVFRRSFCGQICPLGALQGLFGAIGGRVLRKRPEVPRHVDRIARYLKYGVLAIFVVWTWQASALVMRPYDPWVAFAHLTSAELLTELGLGLGVLGLSLAGSVVYERFFCKYVCPTGALLGALSKWSLFGIERSAEVCIDCRACDRACPMNISVSSATKITALECISCKECVSACPAAAGLKVQGPTGRLAPGPVSGGSGVGASEMGRGVGPAAGAVAWAMPSLGDAVKQQDATAGSFDTALIKGYMSMREVASATGIPELRFVERWGVSEADLGKPMKEIGDAYGFSPDDVRPWVSEQLGR